MDNLIASGHRQQLRRDTILEPRAILEPVSEKLAEAETILRDNLASPVAIVHEIGEFVADSGGKRIRPTLHLLSAAMCGYEGPHDAELATVVEYVHASSLIHDDIIDDAKTRRGRPSVRYRWGNDVTVLFGDYLLAKAMELALKSGQLGIMDKLAEVTLRMTEGEMLQTRYVGRLDLSIDEYLDVMEKKTAALFACSCELAGLLARVDEGQQAALRRYGRNVGMAFQMVDDLLDLTGDSGILGKRAGSDLQEGKTTVAVIDLLTSGPSRAAELCRAVMDGRADAGSELSELLQESGALERARLRTATYAEQAVAELAGFHDSPARRSLQALPGLLLDRER